MTARHFYQHRPSADRLGNAPWVYGERKLIGLEPPRRSIWQRIVGRG